MKKPMEFEDWYRQYNGGTLPEFFNGQREITHEEVKILGAAASLYGAYFMVTSLADS